ncbi:hypothetical protein QKU58_gp060 [Pyramimonas orientalis virus]|uniref:Uncharacterized protein n=1 Tax=Pyramimonas orientalis virus 01B TaxID=3134525 RepID=A0A7M3UNK6_9VIRU|nr:hypothetical protein QKU58_gp060 [Pyramimonas orientalis virus]QOI90271.1 hypothetical protein HWQ62_00134 [Pyramimonas orientalis virus]
MYFIRHLPTKTYYGLYTYKNNTSNTSVVCFRTYEEALHIGNSIASFHKSTQKYPSMDSLCNFEKNKLTSDALDMDLFIEKINMGDEFVTSIFNRNLNLKVMMDIQKNKTCIDLTNTYDKNKFVYTLENDLQL